MSCEFGGIVKPIRLLEVRTGTAAPYTYSFKKYCNDSTNNSSN